MYFKEGNDEVVLYQTNHKLLLIVVAIAIIALGLFPDFIIRLL